MGPWIIGIDLSGLGSFVYGIGGGSPGRTRTCDQPVNSRLLYQLSYRGIEISAKEIGILAKLFGE
jgi:hypothetical protein